MENFRKRQERLAADRVQREKKALIHKVLGVMDNAERALVYQDTMDRQGLQQALRMLLWQMNEVMRGEGLTPVPSVGEVFDPYVHEAIETVEDSDQPEGTVVEEVLKGYKLVDETLGPNWQEQFGFQPGAGRRSYSYRGSPMDFDTPTGFSDFFEALFGRSAPQGAGPGSRTNRNDFRRRAGDNIEQPVEVTLQEAYVGGTRTFNIQSTEVCPIWRGTGEVGGKAGANCGGQGMRARNKRIQVKIPAGVENGSRIRVAGEGQPPIGVGPRAALFPVFRVHPAP